MPVMTPWKKRRLLKRLADSFGRAPEKEYFPGDMERIRTFYDACRDGEADRFHVDETTWNDLDMDSVYKRVNACQCTAGEQYLYYQLRTPMEEAEYREGQRLVRLMEACPETRLKLQLLLSGIGRSRDVDLTAVVRPGDSSPVWLAVCSLMGLLLAASILAAVALGGSFFLLPLAMIVVNTWLHTLRRVRCEHEINRVNYCVSLIVALNRLKKMKLPELDTFLANAYQQLEPMKPVLRAGPVLSTVNADMVQAAVMVNFLLDLVAFEILKRRLAKYHDQFLAVHRAIGRLDAAIAAASCRAGFSVWCEPEIDFAADRPYLRMEGMVHPLLKAPVPNDLMAEKLVLITGSNASGKSTCLRTAAVCVLMSQTLCGCTCSCYAGASFRVYTSLALTDDLLAGESRYMAEIRSLKRILDARDQAGFLFCAIDEMLRGTNTIERIAASAEILKALNHPRFLCLAATHDAELCGLAGGDVLLAHFEEKVSDGEVRFDYRLKPGPAVTRNAILLLRLMGFEESLVSAADARAEAYIRTGKWTTEGHCSLCEP